MYILLHGASLCCSYIDFTCIFKHVCVQGHDVFLNTVRSPEKLKKNSPIYTHSTAQITSHFHPEQPDFLISLEV